MYEKLDKLREEVRRAEKRKKYADEKFNTLQEKLREADRALRPLPYKAAIRVARAFMLRKSRKGQSAG